MAILTHSPIPGLENITLIDVVEGDFLGTLINDGQCPVIATIEPRPRSPWSPVECMSDHNNTMVIEILHKELSAGPEAILRLHLF